MSEQLTAAEIGMCQSALKHYHGDRLKVARRMNRQQPGWWEATRFQDVLDEMDRIRLKLQKMKAEAP